MLLIKIAFFPSNSSKIFLIKTKSIKKKIKITWNYIPLYSIFHGIIPNQNHTQITFYKLNYTFIAILKCLFCSFSLRENTDIFLHD